jgi:hypothetical protein
MSARDGEIRVRQGRFPRWERSESLLRAASRVDPADFAGRCLIHVHRVRTADDRPETGLRELAWLVVSVRISAYGVEPEQPEGIRARGIVVSTCDSRREGIDPKREGNS